MFASERIEDGIERVFEIHFIARYVSNFRCLARYTFPAVPLPNSDNSSYLSNKICVSICSAPSFFQRNRNASLGIVYSTKQLCFAIENLFF